MSNAGDLCYWAGWGLSRIWFDLVKWDEYSADAFSMWTVCTGSRTPLCCDCTMSSWQGATLLPYVLVWTVPSIHNVGVTSVSGAAFPLRWRRMITSECAISRALGYRCAWCRCIFSASLFCRGKLPPQHEMDITFLSCLRRSAAALVRIRGSSCTIEHVSPPGNHSGASPSLPVTLDQRIV